MIRILILLAFVSASSAQVPVVGDINFYGFHRLTTDGVLTAARLKSGERLPPSKGAMEDAITQLDGVDQAWVEAVCCQGDHTIVFVGIEEKGAPRPTFRPDPSGSAVLPQELLDQYQEYLTDVERAAARGRLPKLTTGQPVSSDWTAHALEEKFVKFATDHLSTLHDTVRNSAEPDHRAVAVGIMNFAPDKRQILEDIQYALQDPDDTVRGNAVRALTALATLAKNDPKSGVKVSPALLFDLLTSVVLSDRIHSMSALVTMSDGGAEDVLRQLRAHSLGHLAEMARWKTDRYAWPPFLLLGRAAGMKEDAIKQAWDAGDREGVIEKVLTSGVKP